MFYRQTTNSSLLARATSEIRTAFQNNITITNLVIATWDAVGYFEINDDKVSYTLKYIILIMKCLCCNFGNENYCAYVSQRQKSPL